MQHRAEYHDYGSRQNLVPKSKRTQINEHKANESREGQKKEPLFSIRYSDISFFDLNLVLDEEIPTSIGSMKRSRAI